MLQARTLIHLLVRPHPRGVSPLSLLLRSADASSSRFFHPHIGSVWERIVRPSTGGPALIALAGGRAGAGKGAGSRPGCR